MRPALIIGALLYLSAGNLHTFAQTAKDKLDKLFTETTPEQRADLQSRIMEEKLHLTEDQKLTVGEINQKYAQKMQDVYNDGGRNFRKYKHMRSLSNDRDKELKKVLTGDQYDLYLKNKDEVKEMIRQHAEEAKQDEAQVEKSDKVYETFLTMKYSQ